jgi:hypothetical protein
MIGSNGATEDGDDEVLLVEAMQPMVQRVTANRSKTHLKTQVVRSNREFSPGRCEAAVGRRFDEHAEGKGFMDDSLSDIQNDNLMPGKRAGEFCGEAGAIGPRKMDEDGPAEVS